MQLIRINVKSYLLQQIYTNKNNSIKQLEF